MNKKVIYTSLTGNYDNLPQYPVTDQSFDYICFSNDFPEDTKIGHWIIKPIPFYHSDPIYLSRYPKLQPHNVVSEYEWSLWIDSNVSIIDKEFYEIIKRRSKGDHSWYGISHPKLDCIYEDIRECLIGAKIQYRDVRPHLNFLKQEGFPHHFGLFENNVILRKHNDTQIIKINNLWWSFFLQSVKRDQLSLFYIFWKLRYTPQLILAKNENTHNSKYFCFKQHNKFSIEKRIINKFIRWLNISHLYYDKIITKKEF